LSPVLILHSQQVADMNFDNFPKIKLLRIERSEFFQFIKESNRHIAVGNELRKSMKIDQHPSQLTRLRCIARIHHELSC
jgi:hypothetical protein